MSRSQNLRQVSSSSTVENTGKVQNLRYFIQLSHGDGIPVDAVRAAGGVQVDVDTFVFDIADDPAQHSGPAIEQRMLEVLGPPRTIGSMTPTEPSPFGVITPDDAARIGLAQMRASGPRSNHHS